MVQHFAWLTMGTLSLLGSGSSVGSAAGNIIRSAREHSVATVCVIPGAVSLVGFVWQQQTKPKDKPEEKQSPSTPRDVKKPVVNQREELSKRLESRRDVLQKEGKCTHKKCEKGPCDPSIMPSAKKPEPAK